MRSRQLISLFEDRPSSSLGVSSYAVSLVIHGIGIAMVFYSVLHTPPILDPAIAMHRYSVRQLELHAPQPAASKIPYPGPLVPGGATDPDSLLASQWQLPRGVKGLQTLIQPNLRLHTRLAVETPVPALMIWTPELAATPKIVAPLPDQPTAAPVKPSLEAPNEEIRLADRGIASTDVNPHPKAIPAGTTSPVTTAASSDLHLPPVTVSNSKLAPTPTAVLSVSDVRMVEGVVVLPPVNQTHTSPAAPKSAAQAPSSFAVGSEARLPATPAAGEGGTGLPSSVLPSRATASVMESAEHIRLPKDGQFGVVVVGSSLAEQYPEAAGIWNNRVAYTTYIHVGLSKNWILQYSLTRSAETQSGGVIARLEAPWPYDILRPNLNSADLNADALMIHGVVSPSGSFEQLAVAFPAEFPRTDAVLRALNQWQFRPALQAGKPVAVEVLLIIPDEFD